MMSTLLVGMNKRLLILNFLISAEFSSTKKFIVNSAILSTKLDHVSCAVSAPKILENAGMSGTKIISCYCCMAERRVVFIVESDEKDRVLEALNRINVTVASIMEVEKLS
jgi:hypothetical protein